MAGAGGGAVKVLIEGAKALAQSEGGRKAAAAAATAVGKGLSKVGADRLGRRRLAREQGELAEGLARQTGAKLSRDTVIANTRRTVVWVEGKPLAAFPPYEGQNSVEERPELQNFNHDLLEDPPPVSSPRRFQRRGHSRRG